MKTKYKILSGFITLNFIILLILNRIGFETHTWIGNGIGILWFLLPILILLFLLASDEEQRPKRRTLFKVFFYFLIICYMLSGIASLLEILCLI